MRTVCRSKMGCNSSIEQQRAVSFYADATLNGRDDMDDDQASLSEYNQNYAGERDLLQKYLDLERQITINEASNPFQMLEIKSQRWHQLLNDLEAAHKQLALLEKIVATDLGLDDGAGGVNSVQLAMARFSEPSGSDPASIQEHQEYFAILNKEEMALKTVQALQEEKANLQDELVQLQAQVDLLNSLYRQQDQLLDDIFGQKYGSRRENVLEAELDLIEERRAAIVQVDVLWRQARLMVHVASNQLATAIQLWATLSSNTEGPLKFQIAAEVRDNLVAAGQNLLGAHQNLYNVQLPYCTLDEIQALSKATAYVFTDMQTAVRHDQAAQCYQSTYLRSRTLLQWIDQVIKQVIRRDLENIMAEYQDKNKQLRQERINLINAKVNGVEPASPLQLSSTAKRNGSLTSSTTRSTLHSTVILPGFPIRLQDLDGSVDENLAPIPTSAEIFGRVQQLASEHQEELHRYVEDMNTAQGRMNHQLQEVLSERRRRRARKKSGTTTRTTSEDLDEISPSNGDF